MDINKAIRKQKKSYKRFVLSMSFIFLFLPLVLVFSGEINPFFIFYLVVLEILIVVAVVKKIDSECLKYELKNYRIKIKWKALIKGITIMPEKVALVHVEGQGKDITIVIITTSSFRNRKVKPVVLDLLKKYPLIHKEYTRIKKFNPEHNYYYFTVKNGGYEKYKLLDFLYTHCLKSFYSEEAILCIREYRGLSQNKIL